MGKPKTTFGDFRVWSTTVMHEQLAKVIESKQDHPSPYYILCIIKKGYFGPPAKNLQGHTGPTKTMDFSKKITFSLRLVLKSEPPLVPMIGTALWYVNNKTGEVRNIYILPPDTPTIAGGDEDGEGSELVHRQGKNMPLVYSKV